MASSIIVFSTMKSLGTPRKCQKICTRYMTVLSSVNQSRYGPMYMDPTFRKVDLESPLEDNDPRRFQPIKAAANEQTSSLTYDPLVAKFVRLMIRRGDKETARKCIDKTFEYMKLAQLEKYHTAKNEEEREEIILDPMVLFHNAVENCKPVLVTQQTRRGGITYTVPVPCNPSYQQFKAMRWLIDSCREKDKDRRFWDRLSAEIIAANNNQGKAIRKKQELHRLCEANRAYAHYRW